MGTASSWTVSYEQQYLGTAWDQKPHLDIPLMFRRQYRQCLTERKKKDRYTAFNIYTIYSIQNVTSSTLPLE